jgi:hypothetical protein
MYLRVADNYVVTLSAGGVFLNSTLAANLDAWNYVAFVTDGTQRKLFLNGEWEVWDESALPSLSTNPLYIGNSPAGDRHYQGIIDEVVLYSRALSKAEVRYLAGDRAPLDPSLIAWWQLDDNTDDSTGNGHNGTIEGAPTWLSPGWDGAGACMQFGGDADRITVDSFDVTGTGITLAAWINPITLMNDARMVSKSQGSGTADHYWAMILSGSGEDNLEFRFRTDTGSTTRRTSPDGTEVLANEWTHVAATWDAGDPVMRLYRNGTEIDSVDKAGSAVATAADVMIGIGNQSATVPGDGAIRPFGGLLDDVRVYDRGLSPAEILELAGQ